MHFIRSFLLAVVTAPFLVLGQDANGPNPFTLTSAFTAAAGQTSQLTWTPTTQGTVSLILRQGNTADLTTVSTIASGIANSGSYAWAVPSSTLRSAQYTIEIVSDSDPTAVNYSGRFVLASDNVIAPTTSGASTASSTNTLSTAPTGLTPSHFPDNTRITIETTPPSASSMSTSMTSGSTSMTMTTGASTTGSSSASSSASAMSSSTDQAGLVSTGAPTSTGAAPRATAMIGMLGAVALGALAL